MGNPVVELNRVREYMKASLLERDDQIDAVLSALVAGHHPFLLGPPGTAKTMLVEKLSACFTGARFFRCLVSPTTVVEDLFGPMSIRALREDRREREMDGYLPTADFVYLDEVFKGNSATLNALLTAINERKIQQGSQFLPIPLRTLFASSNEVPQSETLRAMYDRFAVRLTVDYMVDDANFEIVMSGELPSPEPPELSLDTITAATAAARKVKLSDAYRANVIAARAVFNSDPQFKDLQISDRRWTAAAQFARARVYLDGGDTVEGDDIRHIACCLWEEPEQAEIIADQLRSMCSSGFLNAHVYLTAAQAIVKEVGSSTDRNVLFSALDSFAELLAQMDGEHPEIIRVKASVKNMAQKVQDKLNSMNRIFLSDDAPF